MMINKMVILMMAVQMNVNLHAMKKNRKLNVMMIKYALIISAILKLIHVTIQLAVIQKCADPLQEIVILKNIVME